MAVPNLIAWPILLLAIFSFVQAVRDRKVKHIDLIARRQQ
jgi:hypothetical protein